MLPFSTNLGHEEPADKDSWDTWLLGADTIYLCIRDYYDTEDGKNEGIVICEEGRIDTSEYEEEDN